MVEKVLQLENVSKSFGPRKAVDGVSLTINSGEIIGFLGVNGAGKSTTMKMILGLTNLDEGKIYIDGYDIEGEFEKAIARVGGMIETPTLYPYLTGAQNLKYFASLYKGVPSSQINNVAKLVGLDARLKDKVKNYSLGMKQRLGIAQALLTGPKLLILDEPTNGLDANGIIEIKATLKNLAKNNDTAILISSHVLSILESLCDKIAIIDGGKLLGVKTLAELRSAYKMYGSTYIKTGTPNLAGQLIKKNFKIDAKVTSNKVLFNASEDKLASIIVMLTKNKIPVYSAGEVEYSLEDLFLNIVGNKAII